MKILGLVASSRKLGNSEVLVKKALQFCRNEGAEVKLCRLTDLNIRPCRGCYKCIRYRKGCSQQDDMQFLLDHIAEADGVVLGFPVYVYNMPGIMKMIQDRIYMISGMVESFKGKKGLVIVSAAFDNIDIAASLGELFLRTFLIETVGTVTNANSSIPGKTLLHNPDIMLDLQEKTHLLVTMISNKISVVAEGCPFCIRHIVQVTGKESVQCPLCERKGRLWDGSIRWDDRRDSFQADHLVSFFLKWEAKTYAEFLENKQSIFSLLTEYKDKNCKIDWINEQAVA